jgi:hydroxypyruvate isomerase
MRFSASLTLLFHEVPLPARFAAAASAGFRGVELQRLEGVDPGELAAAARAAEVEVVLINAPVGDYAEGGAGLSGVPGREAAFRAGVAEALAAARLMGAAFVHLGPSRVPPGATRAACLAAYETNLEAALAMRSATDPVFLVEAMNRVDAPTALLADVDEAAAIVGGRFRGRLGLQFDIYHTAMNGRDPAEAFRSHASLVRHVQFADAPGRHEPGTGAIDFAAAFGALAACGYPGWVGAEYRPSGTTPASLGWRRRWARGEAA